MKIKRLFLFLSVGLVVVLVPLLAACGGGTPVSDPAAIPTAIPHTLEGRDDCLMCHGERGVKPVPVDHAGRSSDTCTGCHSEA